MTEQVQLTLLGGLSITDPRGLERKLPTRKTRALAVYLAMHPGRMFPRAKLADLLWADEREPAARHSLRQALSSIRELLGAHAIMIDGEAVGCREGALAVDAIAFEHMTKDTTLAAAEDAERIYRGEFLNGYETDQPGFDDWVTVERERFRDMARCNLGQLLARRALDPDLDRAIATARSLIRLDPFDEGSHRELMLLYVRQGRSARALRHFQWLNGWLRKELGAGPDAETCAMQEAICAQRSVAYSVGSLAESAFVLEQLPHCVVVTDLANRVIGWNRSAEDQFGFTKSEMCGRTPTLLYAPARDQTLADTILKSALAKGKWSRRVRLLSKDGRTTYQIRTVSPLNDRSGNLIGAFGVGTPCAEMTALNLAAR
jgi:PAS domain S-box-containing protein